MSPDDPRGSFDRDPRHPDRRAPPGATAGAHGRPAVVHVFEARADGQGGWRLDESAAARGGWVARLKQSLLVALSLAVAATLWVFAFALMLVLLPLVAAAGWWAWRRVKSMQRSHVAGRARARSDAPD